MKKFSLLFLTLISAAFAKEIALSGTIISTHDEAGGGYGIQTSKGVYGICYLWDNEVIVNRLSALEASGKVISINAKQTGKWQLECNSLIVNSTSAHSFDTAMKLSDDDYLAMKRMSPAYSSADSELNKAFSFLRKTLSQKGKEQLKADQKNWINMRDQKLSTAGAKGSNSYMSMLVRLTKERTAYLQSLQ
jgi:uncharacterized protein YecT (DUF1311 family)